MGLRLAFGFGIALALGASACGSAAGKVSAACTTCTSTYCANETAACDESSGCTTLRSCALACAPSDSTCKNNCTAMVSNDSAAVVAGANLLACADAECHDECWPPPGTGSAGTTGTAGSSNPGTGNTGQGGTTGSAGVTGTGGTGGTAPEWCPDYLRWATSCAVDTEPMFRQCPVTDVTKCNGSCYLNATCNEYQMHKAGVPVELTYCLAGCAVVIGGATAPTCANTMGKLNYCLGLTTARTCSDTDAGDKCYNGCVIAAPCSEIMHDPLNPFPTAYKMCADACEATGGGTTVFTVAAGGYVTAGSWKGYAWAGKDSTTTTTISPADYSMVPAGGPLCLSGTVAASATYAGVAILGLNVNQALGVMGEPAPPVLDWAPTGFSGVAYDITNNGTSELRIQVQSMGGDTDALKRWCGKVVGKTGVISWADFNTTCWDNLGASYAARGPLVSVMVLVPGAQTAVPYNFCLNSLTPF